MKKRTRALALCLAWTLALTVPAFAAGETTSYTDVPQGAWYEQAVDYCRENGLMTGTGENKFSPEGKVTRAMLAVVLHRMAGSPAVTGESGFSDVPANAWYAQAVCWASRNGVMGGYGGGRFGPADPVTREQLAAVFWRLAGSPAAQGSDFADEGDISSYAVQAVDWARATQLMGGTGGNRFAPAGSLTRAQLAQVLANHARQTGTASQVSAIDVMCQPCGLAAMKDGSLLVTDGYNKVIWRVSEGRRSLLFAGSNTVEDVYGQPVGGYHDDTLLESIFKGPWSIVPFLDGWAVSDPANQVVRFLRTGGKDGEESAEVTDLGFKFDHPTGLAVDEAGNLYVSETFQGKILKISTEGKTSTIASNLSEPMGLCWADGALYIAECGGNRVLKAVGNQVTTVAGSGENGNAGGPADQAMFSGPKGVAVTEDGTVYIADTDNGAVRRVKDGQVTTILSRDPWDLTALYPAAPTGLLIQDDVLYISDTFARKVLALPLG